MASSSINATPKNVHTAEAKSNRGRPCIDTDMQSNVTIAMTTHADSVQRASSDSHAYTTTRVSHACYQYVAAHDDTFASTSFVLIMKQK